MIIKINGRIMKHIFGGCFSLATISIILLINKIIGITICDFIYGWVTCVAYNYGVEQHDKVFSNEDENNEENIL